MRWRKQRNFGLEVGCDDGDPALAGEQREVVLSRRQGHAHDATEETILCIRIGEWGKRGFPDRGLRFASRSRWIGPSTLR